VTLKQLLIAAYYFPPYALVSVVRVTKFCKYLPQFGWQPSVLTVDPHYYRGRILEELPPEVEKIRIHRLPFYRIPGAVTLTKLFFPLIIILFALRNKKNIDAVFLSGSPFYPFIAAVILKGMLGIPTVLDFRDSWSRNYGYDGRPPAGLLKIKSFFFEIIERISIRFSSVVTFSTDALLEEYRRLIPGCAQKYCVITNGYDAEDFAAVKPQRLVSGKTMILTGQFNVYTPEVASGLMQALKSFPWLHFIYAGSEYRVILEKARAHDIETQVTVLPYLAYREILSLIAGADYCLLTNGMVNGMGTKIFDYLALKKPTLCFVPRGSVIKKHFAHEQALVISEAPHSPASIKKGLISLFELQSVPDDHGLEKYSRKEAARSLARLLDSAGRNP